MLQKLTRYCTILLFVMLLASLLFVMLLASHAIAQDVNGTITGVVRDATGAVVPAATVRATNTGTEARFDSATDSDGVYAFRSIPIGIYDIHVEAAGFKRFEAKAIRLQVNEVARYDISVEVGGHDGNRDRYGRRDIGRYRNSHAENGD